MIHLEKLDLSLHCFVKRTFLNGNDLILNVVNPLPFLKKLTFNICSYIRFNNQLTLLNNEDIQHTFNLVYLDLTKAYQDYYEQFLFDTKTCLPHHICIDMNYKSARKVTRNFRRNSFRSNCAKMRDVLFFKRLQYPKHLKDYFPCAKIY